MKALFVCNTPSQIIYATDMILNNLDKFWDVDVIITDQFRNSETVATRYKETNVVNDVFFAKVREKCARGKRNIIDFIIPGMKWRMFDVLRKLTEYDYLFTCNIDVFTTILFAYLSDRNRAISVARYEEGYSSYFPGLRESKQCKMLNKILKVYGKRVLGESIKEYWYFEPEFAAYKHTNDVMKHIKPIKRKDDKLKKTLNHTFGIEKPVYYKEKYIFFEESYVINGIDIDDLGLVERFAKIVGKEQIIIRMHPRMIENRFKNAGFKTAEPDGTPWEMIQFNNDFSDKVFVTISSGSVLASKIYFDDDVKTILLFKMLDKNVVGNDYANHLDKIMKKHGNSNFYIPSSWSEINAICEG